MACLALFVLGLGACDEAPKRAVRLLPIERLLFVPSGSFELWTNYSLWSEQSLLVGRYEVTRGEWRAWAAEAKQSVPPDVRLGGWVADRDDLPATGMTLAEAQAFAKAQGMRLPSVTEWGWCAAGKRGLAYPYGTRAARSAGNTLEVGLDRPADVGTFPGGRTLFTGIEDLFGNVEEWAIATDDQGWLPRGLISYQEFAGLDAWAMGGSWRDPWRQLYNLDFPPTLLGRELEPGHRSVQLGLRLVVEAKDYLMSHAAEYSDPALAERMQNLGRAWGSAAEPLLLELAQADGASAALGWLLEGASN